MTTPKKRGTRSRGRRTRARPAPAVPAEASETSLDAFLEQPPAPAPPEPVETAVPEPAFAARVPPPEPERPRPTVRRAIFFDVENSSRADHVARVLDHLDVERITRATDLIAVGNWRVINHETARMLAQRGAQLVHSAPSVGVRDWSDLRIAVGAGVWLAAARPGDSIQIVTDDQAFDAVGDVATSLGVDFHRVSYRGLTGATGEEVREAPAPARDSRSRRRRRGGRRGHREPIVTPRTHHVAPPASNGAEESAEGHTAPHDELLAVARELLAGASDRTVSIDALSNALKAHGFRRTPGSPRLITRLRRIKELDVGRNGAIRLVDAGPDTEPSKAIETVSGAGETGAEGADNAEPPTPASGQRRRRRRGGRRRRGRGGGQPAVATT